jgi:hypothetical protein
LPPEKLSLLWALLAWPPCSLLLAPVYTAMRWNRYLLGSPATEQASHRNLTRPALWRGKLALASLADLRTAAIH